MKTTVDLPDPLFRRAKATAAHRGISLKALITQAVANDLEQPKTSVSELLESLPSLPRETIETVTQRVADMDAGDLALQVAEAKPERKA
ncbi:MAG: hypothetical protein ACFE0O_14310 [Opitutales bacterium]